MGYGYRPYISPEGATTAVTGTYVDVAGSQDDIMVSVEISGTATVIIEGSMDGTNFIPLQTITATTIWQLAPGIPFYRCRISAITSGTVSCKYGAGEGRNREMGNVSPEIQFSGGPQ